MDKQALANWLSGPVNRKEIDALTLEMELVMRQPETCSALGMLREIELREVDHDGDTALPMSYTRKDGTIQDNEVAFMYPNKVQVLPIRK